MLKGQQQNAFVTMKITGASQKALVNAMRKLSKMNFRPALQKSAEYHRTSILNNFKMERGQHEKWKPWSNDYVERTRYPAALSKTKMDKKRGKAGNKKAASGNTSFKVNRLSLGPILQLEGTVGKRTWNRELIRSFQTVRCINIDPKAWYIFTKVIYAPVHQFGAFIKGAKIPKREFLFFSRKDIAVHTKIFKDFLLTKLAGVRIM